MQLTLSSTNVELDHAIREYVERRLRFVFTRFSEHINRISLSVENAERSARGVDSCCKICVKLIPKEEVEIEVHDADIRSAVARAVDRVARAVERRIAQQRSS